VSLILGHAASDIGFLVADTLLSFPNEKYDARKPAIERFHALKIHILTPEIAVAFAGNVERALKIIRRLQEDLAVDSSVSAPERLLDLSRELAVEKSERFRGDCEFLVLTLGVEQKTLARIATNQVHYATRAYIGDPAEYKRLRGLTRDYDGPAKRFFQDPDGKPQTAIVTDGEKEFEQVSTAMERLTDQKNSETVGAICGCVTRVVDARISKKLEYMQSGERGISAAEGITGFSLLASNSETRGIGIYYYGWNAGLIFVVGDAVPCRKETATTIKQFVEAGKSKYGLSLEGVLW